MKKRTGKRWWRLILVLSLTVVGILVIWLAIVFLSRPKYQEPDTKEWETGDIFFAVGDSWKSVAVRSLTGAKNISKIDSMPSHCGIVIRKSDGIYLVHASTTEKRIIAETPRQYMKESGAYCIYKRKSPCVVDTTLLIKGADSLLNNRVAFDFNFDHSESKTLYCTEMVLTLLENSGCHSLSDLRDRNYIYPQDILERCKR